MHCAAVAEMALTLAALQVIDGYCRPPRTEVMRCVLKPSQCIRPT
jgi:hypothetical protein